MRQPYHRSTEALRYGTRCKGSHSGICPHAFIRERYKPRLCLPSRNCSSFYRLRRDGRLSRPSWLVTYPDGLPVRRQPPIQILTAPTLIDFVDPTNNVDCWLLRHATRYICSTSVNGQHYSVLSRVSALALSVGPFTFTAQRWPVSNVTQPSECS